ncbi:hypothetical protein MD484_g7811, partial [Candolleomyces efflorescens]
MTLMLKNASRKAQVMAQQREELRPSGRPALTLADISTSSASFLEGAQHFQMRDLNVTVNAPPTSREPGVDGWKLLVEKISRNAFHNSSARYDTPKCDEDTRVELTSEIMDRIMDRDNPQRLLCITGAAGSGKSALQQTIAERCESSGILGSAYFFSSTDPTRNTISTVVATIAFQVGSHNRDLKQAISKVVVQDPVIFDRSLRAQMDILLVRPMKDVRDSVGLDLYTLPHAILIDDLDECQGEERQEELLNAIRECLLTGDMPFCVFIAGRPEWAIRTALAPNGHLHALAYHIQLSEHYDASGDMHRFLQRRFKSLSTRTPNPLSFTERNIQALVEAGSGQFIYVATVYRWISERRASPTERLKIVLNWTLQRGQTARPFQALDQLYTNILLNAKNAYEAVDTHSGRDFLLLFKIHHTNSVSGLARGSSAILDGCSKDEVAQCLDLESDSLEVLISDLHSLVSIQGTGPVADNSYLHIHHKSFSDFLDDKERAKDLFVPPTRVYGHLASCCLLHIIQAEDSNFPIELFPNFWRLGQVSAGRIDGRIENTRIEQIIDFTQGGGWQIIDCANVRLGLKAGYHRALWHDSAIEGVKSRNPEAFEVMTTYLEKWKQEYDKIGGETEE